jgi:AbrB family looped-hinge helix DNA binding protein
MSSAQSRITAQGQVSVPAEIRRKLGVGPGSILEWQDEGDHVIVRRAARYSSEDIHRAVFARPPAPRTAVELKEGIAEHIRKKHARR